MPIYIRKSKGFAKVILRTVLSPVLRNKTVSLLNITSTITVT